MKTAIIKQFYDCHGPWQSTKWQDADPVKIFDNWPSKPALWGMTCLLKADWYIVPLENKLRSDYEKDILKTPERKRIMEKYTSKVTEVKDIPFEDYDLVITMDPLSGIPKKSKTLFAYYAQEDWDWVYFKSLKEPFEDYDLFLDPIMTLTPELSKLPQSVSFPILFNYDAVNIFKPVEEKEVVWIDWRLLCAMQMINFWSESAKNAAERLQDLIGISVRFKGSFNKVPMGIFDPPLWGDSINYFKAMAECKYYVGVGRYSGPGQGACEAASLGVIAIGEKGRVYHEMVCHPECLCSDMVQMPKILRHVISSPSLQREILEYQNKALKQKFAEQPLALLERAVKMKQKI